MTSTGLRLTAVDTRNQADDERGDPNKHIGEGCVINSWQATNLFEDVEAVTLRNIT
jgi:hypothetical protein